METVCLHGLGRNAAVCALSWNQQSRDWSLVVYRAAVLHTRQIRLISGMHTRSSGIFIFSSDSFKRFLEEVRGGGLCAPPQPCTDTRRAPSHI